jgi:TadE-like protein
MRDVARSSRVKPVATARISCRGSSALRPGKSPRHKTRAVATHHDRGATMVETALTIFTFLVAMLAVMEMAMMLYSYAVISAAAKEGVRYAAVVGNTTAYTNTANWWALNEVPGGCPFGATAFSSAGDPTVGIQCKVWDYARYSLQDVSGTKLGVRVTFQPSNDADCPAGTSPLWSVPCQVRVAVNYTYAPLFGIPLTPRMTAVAEARMVN